MIWTIVGTAAFLILNWFEYQKVLSVKNGTKEENPWFLIGTAVLLISCIVPGIYYQKAGWFQRNIGIAVLIAGIIFYARVLFVGTKEKQYTKDSSKTPVIRTGLYGRMRHPGVWSFLICALGFGLIVPGLMSQVLWLSLLNLIYTFLQDRFYFPVYLEGYESYRKEVPYLAFWKRKDTNDMQIENGETRSQMR